MTQRSNDGFYFSEKVGFEPDTKKNNNKKGEKKNGKGENKKGKSKN